MYTARCGDCHQPTGLGIPPAHASASKSAPPLAASGDADQLQSLLQRWRVLLPQGVASIVADRLGAALLAKAEGEPVGEQLRAAIGRIRVGVTTDTAGTIRRY